MSGILFFIFASCELCELLNRPPVFANYFENYTVLKEVMKEMFQSSVDLRIFLGPISKLNLLLWVSLQI